MKKLLTLFLALVATTALRASNTITYTATEKLNGYKGSLEVGETTFGPAITSHTFNDGTGTITCRGEVTRIGVDAFYKCSGLTSVTIPNSVSTIGDLAFGGCSGLISVTIPNSVTNIQPGAFDGCKGLTSVTIPNSVTTISISAFAGCSSLTSVTIPNSVTIIGAYAFYGCTGLTSVTIPNSVTTIDARAFYECTGLTSVTIPNSVTTIGELAFADCTGLTSVTIPNSVTKIGSYAFNHVNNIVYNGTATGSPWGAKCVDGYIDGYFIYSDASKTTLCGCSSAATGEITIPNSVTKIQPEAFCKCSGLTSVTIPNSVTKIGGAAFFLVNNIVYNGTATGSPWSAKCVNGYVEGYLVYSDATKTTLCGCSSAATGEVIIPNSVTTIGNYAFESCYGLTSVTIPNSVTTIGNYAFESCYGLTSVTIPNSVTTIGDWAFEDCSGLTSVTIPNSVTWIGYGAFSGCSGLTSVTIGNSVTSIEGRVFYECSGLTSVTIPNSVTTIGWGAFDNCTGLTSVTIPNSVTTIGNQAFHYCHSLTSFTIPNSVTTIGDDAFDDCTGLTSVTIGNSVTTIGERAFGYCSGLTSITCYAENPPKCGSDCFKGVHKDIPLYISNIASLNAYKSAAGWKEFTNIIKPFYGVCGEDLHWKYANGTLSISGTGEMFDFTQRNSPWLDWKDSVINIIFPSEITSIGKYAFYGFSKLTSVTIPNSVTTIGDYAFESCYGLTSVTIPNSVTTIGNSAFSGCSGLTSITIPNSVTTIGRYTFYGCTGLNLVTIPNSVTTIEYRAFVGCSGLTSVTIGNSVTSIGDEAFAGCKNIRKITCFAKNPPICGTSVFSSLSQYTKAYVLASSLEDYQFANVWRDLNLYPIESEVVPLSGDQPIVTPTDQDVTITWPITDGTDTYTLTITKNGETVCVLTFNANGQLTNIAFAAPGHNGARQAPAATLTAQGYQFTVIGLNPGTAYNYSVTATDAKGKTLAEHKGNFSTTGGTGFETVHGSQCTMHKYFHNGNLIIERNGVKYTPAGQKVR